MPGARTSFLPFSHDEVVHMKGALLNKMPGDEWQKFANLRALYGYMWAHPGKKLLFMGGEFGQWREWNETESLDWHLLEDPLHKGVQSLIQDLNQLYAEAPGACRKLTATPAGSVGSKSITPPRTSSPFAASHLRREKKSSASATFHRSCAKDHRIGLPRKGTYKQLLNTDDEKYCGGGFGVVKSIRAEKTPWHGMDYSAAITLPPLGTIWFEAPARKAQTESA